MQYEQRVALAEKQYRQEHPDGWPEGFQFPTPRDQDRWGDWIFDQSSLLLTHGELQEMTGSIFRLCNHPVYGEPICLGSLVAIFALAGPEGFQSPRPGDAIQQRYGRAL
jgi:hypothetical protein